MEDDAGDVVFDAGRGEKHFPVSSSIFLIVVESKGFELLLNGAGGLISS